MHKSLGTNPKKIAVGDIILLSDLEDRVNIYEYAEDDNKVFESKIYEGSVEDLRKQDFLWRVLSPQLLLGIEAEHLGPTI